MAQTLHTWNHEYLSSLTFNHPPKISPTAPQIQNGFCMNSLYSESPVLSLQNDILKNMFSLMKALLCIIPTTLENFLSCTIDI